MDYDSRVRRERPFACDVSNICSKRASNMRSNKREVHGDVFKCPQPGCEYSSASKSSVAHHLKGFHGTAGSFACDHPGCTFRSTWRGSIAKHKRHVHSDEKPFACNHIGCEFRTKTRGDQSNHQNTVHLNIRDKRCHICERGFDRQFDLRRHMTTHEGDGHVMENCESCSVNLRSKSSRKTKSAAGKRFLCQHPGCDFESKWKDSLLNHQKYVHSDRLWRAMGQTLLMQPHGMLVPFKDKE